MSEANMLKTTRHPGRAGWQEAETARLFSAVQEANVSGAPLRSVFESLSDDLGRKPNSIRNYYYACLRQQPIPGSLLDERMHADDFCDHHDHFRNTTPESEWKACLEHAEKIGLGSRTYELVKIDE